MGYRYLDAAERKIVAELQRDARLTHAEIARRVGISRSAVGEKVRGLEDRGIIQGYEVRVDPQAVGLFVTAFIRIRITAAGPQAQKLTELALETPEIWECHRTTGDDSFILKVRVESVPALEKLIDRLTPFGVTSTSLVLSSPVERRLGPVG